MSSNQHRPGTVRACVMLKPATSGKDRLKIINLSNGVGVHPPADRLGWFVETLIYGSIIMANK